MINELFYTNLIIDGENNKIIEFLNNYSMKKSKQIFLLNKPLSITKNYRYLKGAFLLQSDYKIIFIDFENNSKTREFQNYIDDILDDLNYVSEKFKYSEQLERPRYWKDDLVDYIEVNDVEKFGFESVLEKNKITLDIEKRNIELIISLLTGSINDIDRVKGDVPESLLDKIKKKIILFDGQQTRFLYQERDSKLIKIQGLAGTGKTELLLHKLKTLYIKNNETKIAFTCYNKILHDTLVKRIPIFFDFMKVEEQIKWNERLWCCRGWGSKVNYNVGLYSFICNHYDLRFYSYRDNPSFFDVCKTAVSELKAKKFEPFFDYILIDESQDFPEPFFELCNLVSKEKVYIAGDIFQNIFNIEIKNTIETDFLLNKCYRTDLNTLMFAHALGMGLFEEKRISWLDKEGLESCGYTVKDDGKNYILSRQPLKRFEDLETSGIKSIELITAKRDEYIEKVLDLIKNIQEDNPTIKPEDIAIMFLKNDKKNYRLVTELQYKIKEELGLDSNIGYETQQTIPNKIMITNRNNIKGLEYPFVICLADNISSYYAERNAAYMMLTRSFITSYLVMNESQTELFSILQSGLDEILTKGTMTIRKATKEEQEYITSNISEYTQKKSIPLDELIYQTMLRNGIDTKYRKVIEGLIEIEIDLTSYENEEIIDFIIGKKEFICGDKK